MSFDPTAVDDQTLALWTIEARLTFGSADDREDTETHDRVFAAFHERVESTGAEELRDLVQTLTDIAFDLADGWARAAIMSGLYRPRLSRSFWKRIPLRERRRRGRHLHAVVMEAYVHGVSTRKVDDLVTAMGAEAGISKSEVSRICAELDTDVAAFNNRDLSVQAFPYVFLDATYCKARVGGDKAGKGSRVASQAVVIATGVSADGRREVLGCAVGDSETQDFWTEFLRGLRDRGLGGVQLVISDHHRGLMNAIDATMAGAAWQGCRVHFMRNVLAKVPKGQSDMVAAAIRTVFAQPTGPLVREQVEVVAVMLEPQLPAVAEMLRDAKEEITAFADFPEAHWRKVWSTNPLERLNREVKRRTDVVGIFPNPAALLLLAACVLIEAHDEWQVAERRYLSEGSMAQLTPPAPTALEIEPRPTREVTTTPDVQSA